MGNIIKGQNADLIEIIIRDYSGAKIEKYICSINDTERLKKIFKILNEKYSLANFFNVDSFLEID